MQSVELPLFPIEDKLLPPLVKIIESPLSELSSPIPLKQITQTLNEIFPEQQYQEKSIQKAKEVLGTLADSITQEQLKDVVCEMQYLADSWLDDFERNVFEGMTLSELLHEKGGR